MPTRNYYECRKGHITQHILTTFSKYVRCGKEITTGKTLRKCQAQAEVIYISDRKGQNALNFKPIEFFINSEGEVVNIGCGLNDLGKLSSKAQRKMRKYIRQLEKKGYKHTSLSTIQEYETFRREHNSRLSQANLEQAIGEDLAYSTYIKQELDDLKRGFMLKYPDGSEVSIPPLDKFDHPEVAKLAKDLMEDRPLNLDLLNQMPDSPMKRELMEINSQRTRSTDAGFHIDAMENYEGNRRSTWI